jgi:hypothetical protein
MSAHIRTTAAMLAALVLFGCATTQKPNSKPEVARNPNCLTDTGGNINDNKLGCRGFGRSYSSDDIARTGATKAGDALILLDPSITQHR